MNDVTDVICVFCDSPLEAGSPRKRHKYFRPQKQMIIDLCKTKQITRQQFSRHKRLCVICNSTVAENHVNVMFLALISANMTEIMEAIPEKVSVLVGKKRGRKKIVD